MSKWKKTLSVAVVFCMLLSVFVNMSVFADQQSGTQKGTVTISVEKFTVGQGYIKEPAQMPFYEGDTVGMVLARLLGSGNYNGGTDSENITWLSSIKDENAGEINIPQYIQDAAGTITPNADEWLGEKDFTAMSGWMYIVNNALAPDGMGSHACVDGDVVRVQFSVYGFGADIGYGWDGSLIEAVDKDALTKKVAEINSRPDKASLLSDEGVKDWYDTALIVLETLEGNDQESVDLTLAELDAAVKNYDDSQPEIDRILGVIAEEYKTSSSEWCVMDMVAYGLKDEITDEAKAAYLNKGTALVNSSKKGTDFSKTAIVMTALGLDPRSVPGKNGATLDLIDMLATSEGIDGINGASFALLAYDSGDYPVSDKTWTRESIISYIKDVQHDDGGWALSSDKTKASDPDVTAMAVCALAPYYLMETDTYEVRPAIDRAINCLSALQLEDGQFASWGTKNANSASAVILALSSLGIDADTDSRFVKGENSALDGLFAYKTESDKFGYTNNTKENAMATEQAFRALVAYSSLLQSGQPANVYDFGTMSGDVVRPPQSKTVSIRVEGIGENKLYEKEHTFMYDTQLASVSDIIKSAVGEGNYTITSGDYGDYFSALYGEAEATFGGQNYDGWQYRVNGISPDFSMSGYAVSDKDEIVVYYGSMTTQYPLEPAVTYVDGGVKLTFSAEEKEYGPAPDYAVTVKTVPITGATVTWGYGEGQTAAYTTDETGSVTIPAEQSANGEHSVQIEKYDTSNEVEGKFLPLVVRLAGDKAVTLKNQVAVTEENKEIAVTKNDPHIIYNVAKNVAAAFVTEPTVSGEQKKADLPQSTVNAKIDGNNVAVDIMTGTKITGDSTWDGRFALPVKESNPTVPVHTVNLCFSVGGNDPLTFSKGIRIHLPGMKGNKVGYLGADGTVTEITNVMASDAASALTGEDGKIVVGDDLIVWTKHAGTLVLYTENGGGGPSEITVRFSLIGDTKHDTPEEHDKSVTWISMTNYTMPEGSTVKDLFERALADADLTYELDSAGNYVKSINGLAEFDNGPNAGWLYRVNGKHPSEGFADYTLSDGDRVNWHYVDDYTKEPDYDEDWNNNGSGDDDDEDDNNGGGSGGGGGSSRPSKGTSVTTPAVEPSDETKSIQFEDVSGWSEEYIYYLANKNILTGKSETSFAPRDNITRAELTAILARMSGADLSGYAMPDFDDLTAGAWYVGAVAWASEQGVVMGENGIFRPDDKVTRQEIAVMVNRYAKNVADYTMPEKNEATVFADDSEIAEYAKEAVYSMQKAGIINGKGDNRFAPTEYATREEAAKMIAVFLQEME